MIFRFREGMMTMTEPAVKKKRNTRSWKSEARKHEATAHFYRTTAEQAAKNHRRRLWLWTGLTFWLGLLVGWLVGR
jgi:hypothetical protein